MINMSTLLCGHFNNTFQLGRAGTGSSLSDLRDVPLVPPHPIFLSTDKLDFQQKHE